MLKNNRDETKKKRWCLTFPTMLPRVMMDPLGAPQATRAWATAWVTKNEPWRAEKTEIYLIWSIVQYIFNNLT